MAEALSGEAIPGPAILGGNGDIGRTANQQLLAMGTVPAGLVLTARRLVNEASRTEAAKLIASNYAADGEQVVLDGVELTGGSSPVLRIGDAEIPVFTPDSQHELLQEGHPVIDATGKHKKRENLEPMLEAGARFVVVTSPIHEDERVQTVVYGVNSDDKKFNEALEDGILSTSSCTTTAVTSLLGPVLLGRNKIPLSGALVNVTHARTKSNDPEDIDNNIKLSSSGAIKEIPKVLDIGPDQLAFDLECTRTNAACGSLASVTLLFGSELSTYNLHNLRAGIVRALRDSESSYVIDGDVKGGKKGIKDTKSVIGRTESAVINLDRIGLQRMPGGGSLATDIEVFYDNVAGYTGRVIDSYMAMAAKLDSVGDR